MKDKPATAAAGEGAEPAPRVAEQLSALLDGELPEAEVELLLARFRDPATDAPARGRLARYALVQAALQGSARPEALGVADRVAGVLGPATAPHASAPAPWSRRWLAPGLAAAVAVALAVTIALGPGTGPAPATPGAAGTPGSDPAAPPLLVATAALPPDQLTNYLVYHGEYSGTLSAALVDSHIVGYHPAAALP